MEIPPKVGKYRVLESLGQGASGVVLKVEQEIIGRIVAMKLLFTHLLQSRPIVVRRFKREARLASSLVHSNIVPIFEIGEDNGMHYYTMQYVEGSPMLKHISSGLSLKQKLGICIELCDALALAHRNNIIHRDLKPHNVIVTHDLHPVILDFGIAKSLIEEEQMTQSGHILGSAHYMAPEQAGPGDVGTYTDVFGFGVMMYELIAERRPFQGSNVTQLICDRIEYRNNPQAHRPPWLREIVPSVPEELDRIVFRCIEGHHENRYPSANELLEDLHRFTMQQSFSEAVQKAAPGRYRRVLPIHSRRSYLYPAILAFLLLAGFIGAGMYALQAGCWVSELQTQGAALLQKCLRLAAH